MDEGKELLYKVIDTKLKQLSKINKDDIIFDDVNLVSLLESIRSDISNFSNVTDELLDKVLGYGNLRRKQNYKKTILRARDLLIGKRDYNLKVKLTKEYTDAINQFTDLFAAMLDEKVPGVINVETVTNKCHELKHRLKNHEVVSDYEFIESITNDYDPVECDNNLILIMKYVCNHNLEIIKAPQTETPIFDVQYIRRPKLDDKIKEILDKLEIDYKDLPNYLIGELKRCDVDSVYDTYQLVKKNKAEEYGILHLINKDNILAKLVLILYATPESVMNVVDNLKDAKNNLDIELLKVVINSTLTIFLEKNNEYFKPKYFSFMKTIGILKSLGVNYPALINRTPLFINIDSDVLEYTLNYLETFGANKKMVINRCYKTLAVDPAILIENIDIMKKFNMNVRDFFKPENKNYNLIKTIRLEKKILWLQENTDNLDTSDYEFVNRLIVNKVYKEIDTRDVIWGG